MFHCAEIRKDALSDDRQRLERLLVTLEARIADAFRKFLKQAKSDELVRHLIELIQAGRIEEALGAIDAQAAVLADAVTGSYQQAAIAEALALQQQIATEFPITVTFDPTNPRAAEIMRQERLSFIKGFTDEQRALTRQVITDGLLNGDGYRQMAGAIRDSIGLTQKMEQTVANYRRLLEQGSRDTLSRDLRDRRFDPSLERSVSGGKPLSPEQIDRQVERYRQKMVAWRGDNIARTEAGRALSLARHEAMQQQIDAGTVSANHVEQTWWVTMDGRERLWHATMLAQTRPWGQPFTDGLGNALRYPRDPFAPADTVVNCRCAVTYRIKRAA